MSTQKVNVVAISQNINRTRNQQFKLSRYTTERPQLLPLQWHSFVGQGSHWRPCPPCCTKYVHACSCYQTSERCTVIRVFWNRKIGFYLHVTSRVHTHTHARRHTTYPHTTYSHTPLTHTQLIHTPLYYKACAQHLPVFRNWSSTTGSRRNCQRKF